MIYQNEVLKSIWETLLEIQILSGKLPLSAVSQEESFNAESASQAPICSVCAKRRPLPAIMLTRRSDGFNLLIKQLTD